MGNYWTGNSREEMLESESALLISTGIPEAAV